MKRFWLWLQKHVSFVEAIELVLTVAILILIWLEFQGGNQQVIMLNSLGHEVAVEGRALDNLTETDSKLLSSMRRANDTFQSSLAVTKQVNGAMRNQLSLLEAEQKERLAEAAEKPMIVGEIGGTPLSKKPGVQFPVLKITSTNAVLDFSIENNGTQSLINGTLVIIIEAPDATLTCSEQCILIPELPSISATRRSYQASLARRIAAGGVEQTITLTFQFPRARSPFEVGFLVEGDNYPRTLLGTAKVSPRKN